MNREYWKNFYVVSRENKPTEFAKFCDKIMNDKIVELGCGNGRDLNYFNRINRRAVGIDFGVSGDNIINMDLNSYIEEMDSPDNVYSRFFWHSIDRKLQLKILKWAKKYIFIEARTDKDNPRNLFGKHERNLVNVSKLIKDLLANNFDILYLVQGRGLSKMEDEDPFVVWLMAKK
jgi:hypothetical protein